MKRIYLSGPMSGLPEHNFPAFHAHAAQLRARGFDVVRPAELTKDTSVSWAECLRVDIPALCGCDAIALMPGWERSKGANLELLVAHRLELEVMHLPPVFDFLAHLARQAEFSVRTYGPGPRTKGVLDHIRKELKEIEDAPLDLEEWVDVVILGLDGAWRTGATPRQIVDQLVAKQTKNESRQWPDWRTAPPDKAIEHDRSEEQAEARRREAFDTLPDGFEVN